MRKFPPNLRLYLVILLFSFTGIIAKSISLSALPLIFSRMLIASAALFIFLKTKKISLKIDRKSFLFMTLGGSCMAINWISFFYGIKLSNVSIVLACIPAGAIFTSFLEPIFLKTSFKAYQLILALIIAFCISILFDQIQGNQIKGVIFGSIAAFFSSLSGIFSKILTRKNPVETVSFYQMFMGMLLVGSLFFLVGDILEFRNISSKDWFFIFLLGIVFTAYGKLEAVGLIKIINPYTFQLNLNLEPIYGILIAYLLFGDSEKMNFSFYLITFIMISSIIINQKLIKRFSKS